MRKLCNLHSIDRMQPLPIAHHGLHASRSNWSSGIKRIHVWTDFRIRVMTLRMFHAVMELNEWKEFAMLLKGLKAFYEGTFWLRDIVDRRKTARWSRVELEASLTRRFRQTATYAIQNSPFFADIAASNQIDPTRCSPQDFPELTKNQLIQDFDRIVTEPTLSQARITEFFEHSRDPSELLDERFHVLRTSGSTGTPGYTAFTPREWIRGCSSQFRVMPGLRIRKRLAFVGVTNHHFAGVSLALTGRRGINRLFYDCRAYDLNSPTAEIVHQLNEFQPQVLSGYANVLMMLAHEQRAGRLHIQPLFVCSSGEVMRPNVRQELEATFPVPIVDMYSSSETLFMAAATSAEGFTLFEDDFIFEIFPTHLLVTNVFNRTVPLIRFRIDDVLVPSEPTSVSPFRRISHVAGRNDRPFSLRNNAGQLELIPPTSLIYLPIPEVSGLQVVVVSDRELIFRVKLDSQLNQNLLARQQMLAEIESGLRGWLTHKRLDQSVKLRVDATTQLQLDPVSGKARLIIVASDAKSVLSKAA